MVKPNRLRNIKGCPKSIQKGSKENGKRSGYNSFGLTKDHQDNHKNYKIY